MFLEVTLLAAAYLYRNADLFDEDPPPPPDPADPDLPAVAPPATPAPDRAAVEATLTHYFHAALGTMGILAAAHLLRRVRVLGALLRGAGLAAYCYAAMPYVESVDRTLRRERAVNVDVLFFFGDLLTLGSGQYFTASVGLYLMNLGSLSIFKARDDSQAVLRSELEELPATAWVLRDGQEVETPLEAIRPDHVMVIRAGDVVAVDGEVVEGAALVDQHLLTGESQPVEKAPGDPVLASTLVVSGEVRVRVLRAGSETTSARVVEHLRHATDTRTSVQLLGEEWADRATLPTLAASLLALPTLGVSSAVVLVNSHIGNRIRVFAPAATLRHVSEACRRGVLVRDGRVLERLHEIDTVVFDKTGTLTTGELEIRRILPLGGRAARVVLATAAAAEGRLRHPIARAIVARARAAGIEVEPLGDAEVHVGYGVDVRREGRRVRVGSVRFLREAGLKVPAELLETHLEGAAQGRSLVVVAVDDAVIGALELEACLREEIPRVLELLRAHGVRRTVIVSGDQRHPTRALAEQLGIDEFHHDILPADKARLVAELRARGRRVCFVGDGINDALAMKEADLSVSMAGASSLARDVAEVLFLDESLARFEDLLEISASLRRTLDATLRLTVAPGLVNLAGALVLRYSILTSLVVNTGFGVLAGRAAFGPVAGADTAPDHPDAPAPEPGGAATSEPAMLPAILAG